MDTRDFCFWLQGMLTRGDLSDKQQFEVKTKLDEVLKEEKTPFSPFKIRSPTPFPVDPIVFTNTCSGVGQNACCE